VGKLRIAIVSPWFAEKSTYIESSLPRALARLGHEVHLITTGLQPNYDAPDYDRDYAPAFGAAIQPLCVETIDGVIVHRLPHRMIAGYVAINGLGRALGRLRPDVVQTFSIASWITFACALYQRTTRYRLFTGCHQAAELAFTRRAPSNRSVFLRAMNLFARRAPGSLVSLVSEKCYAVTEDAADVAIGLYGYQPSKVIVEPLGFHDSVFHLPAGNNELSVRASIRARLGITAEEIVCIYTGRFSKFKNPALLAAAVERLRRAGLNYRCLFVGGGDEGDELRRIEGSIVEPFVAPRDLAHFYWASDIAIWPKSYSASQLEAVACGIPIIMSDASQKAELHDISVSYREGDLESLTDVLRGLQSRELRATIGRSAAVHVKERLSWSVIAERRARDYASAVFRAAS
jgi:Glycosyltransferase